MDRVIATLHKYTWRANEIEVEELSKDVSDALTLAAHHGTDTLRDYNNGYARFSNSHWEAGTPEEFESDIDTIQYVLLIRFISNDQAIKIERWLNKRRYQ